MKFSHGRSQGKSIEAKKSLWFWSDESKRKVFRTWETRCNVRRLFFPLPQRRQFSFLCACNFLLWSNKHFTWFYGNEDWKFNMVTGYMDYVCDWWGHWSRAKDMLLYLGMVICVQIYAEKSAQLHLNWQKWLFIVEDEFAIDEKNQIIVIFFNQWISQVMILKWKLVWVCVCSKSSARARDWKQQSK